MTVADAAKAYLARGWSPIRVHGIDGQGICTCMAREKCNSAGKHPTESRWQEAGLGSEAEIDAAYDGWRGAAHNVGLRTGSASGFFALDIDPDNGGTEGIKALQDEYGKLEATCVQRTGSGGWHLLFQMPTDFEPTNRRGGLKDYQGLDIRGTGGQIVAAPSVSGKGAYKWLAEAPPGPAPDWLLDLLRPVEPSAVPVAPAARPVATDGESVRLEGYAARVRDLEVARLVAMAEAAKPGGNDYVGEGWNEGTFQVACSLLELANSDWTLYDIEQARADVYGHAPRDEGFTNGDVAKCLESARNKVGDNGRPYPVARPSLADEISSWTSGEGVRVDPILLRASGGADTPAAAQPGDREIPEKPQRTWDDLGNAKRIVDHFGPGLRWVNEAEQWAIYKAGRWQLVKPNVVQGLVQRMIDELVMLTEGQHYSNVPEDDDKPDDHERGRFEKWLKSQRMSARITAAQKEAQGRAELFCSLADFDAHPMLLNVANGVVDLATGILMPADPKLLLMKQSPVAYDPNATAPEWTKFLERVMPDPQALCYLQRILGYCLTGRTEEQALFLWFGDGANGKSICSSIMTAVMGDYGQTVAPSTLLSGTHDEHPTGVAMMDGRRWLPATETAPGRRLDEEKVKNLTGGEPVSARFMGKNFFDFIPVGKICLITNHLPRLSDAKSIWRRIHLVKWGVSIPVAEQDRKLEQKLRAELPGILAFLVRGAVAWNQAGLAPPQGALEDLARYRDDSDAFGEFLRERTMRASDDTVTSTEHLYRPYQAWCFDRGIRKPMSMQAFIATMDERGYRRHRTATTRGFIGVVPITQTANVPW